MRWPDFTGQLDWADYDDDDVSAGDRELLNDLHALHCLHYLHMLRKRARPSAAGGDDDGSATAPRARPDRDDVKRRFDAIRPRQFKTMFRMDRDAFDDLCQTLAPQLPKRRKTALPVWLKVAVTLRYLAGGSHHDIGFGFSIVASTFYRVVDAVLDAIHATRRVDLDSLFIEHEDGTWEWDVDKLQALEHEFATKKGPWIRGIFGAIDGVAVKILCPPASQTDRVKEFYNRKGFYALVCQGVCDARRRFLFMDARMEGSCPDSLAFGASLLGVRMEMNPPPLPFMLVGDAAYEAQQWMLTPWPGVTLPTDKDAFNFFQSSARIEIECAFGLLCRRWGILWRPLPAERLARTTRIVTACAKLHNWCIDHNDVEGPDQFDGRMLEPQVDLDPQDECEDLERSRPHRRARLREVNMLRAELTQSIKERNGCRPKLTGNQPEAADRLSQMSAQ